MLIIPRATEKSYTEQSKRTYVFQVPADASKQAIAQAVTNQFKVTVTSVRVLTRKGKATRFSRGKHAYPGTAYKQDKKFAYVTLKDGDQIKGIFNEEVDQKPQTEQVSAQAETKTKKGIFKRSDEGEKK
ncbi:MAG: 50S ribosomal protein L23 [Candidatus Saccharibacteria bacterium]|nr:50S ribosomal protein L23 [Candidatus Saccharibacteria bacterium]